MLTENELKELASQLSLPRGDMGIVVAENMHLNNLNMTLNTIDALEVQEGDCVLEVGHGNCSHLGELFTRQQHCTYTGLEISELMHTEAIKANEAFIRSGNASFHLYKGSEIPFEEHRFNKVFTVNTLYFWKDPLLFLNELYRVMAPHGVLCIGFAWRSFMEMLPFTAFGFELYDESRIKTLVGQSAFTLHDLINHKETIKSKSGEEMERDYAVLRLTREA